MPAGLLFDVEYNDVQFVRLRVVNAPIYSADFDLDGDVDGADLVKLRMGFGTATARRGRRETRTGTATSTGGTFWRGNGR